MLTADGGPVEVGATGVIMEHAVLRGTARHRLRDRYWASHQDPRYSTPVRY